MTSQILHKYKFFLGIEKSNKANTNWKQLKLPNSLSEIMPIQIYFYLHFNFNPSYISCLIFDPQGSTFLKKKFFSVYSVGGGWDSFYLLSIKIYNMVMLKRLHIHTYMCVHLWD